MVRGPIDAWHAGEAQPMGESLHDDLVKRGVGEDPASGDIRVVTKAQMVQLTRDGVAARAARPWMWWCINPGSVPSALTG